MLYLRNTSQVQTIDNRKNIGGRETCYYGFITNNSYISKKAGATYGPTNPQPALWKWYPCDNPTETNLLLSAGAGFAPYNGPTSSIGCMSSTRYTIPPPSIPLGDGGRENQLFFSPFTCETAFTQSMTTYEYVTFTAFGPSGSRDEDTPFALASYIPSGSTNYTYQLIQLIGDDNYPGPAQVAPISGTPVLGPIAVVSGSAYWSKGSGTPQTTDKIVYAPYP